MNLSNPNNQPPLDDGLLLFECPICRDKLRTSPQIHYGVSACFSCKAFFRRAHKNSTVPNFKCENDNKCQGTQRWKTRRKCQKCRLDICLKMGMKPEAVLTDDQKKNRFRKSSQKKSDCGGNRENYVESEGGTEMLSIDFDNISMSTPSTSGYSVDIKEEPITIRSIMNMLPKSPDDQLHEEIAVLTDDQKKIRFRKSAQKKPDCGGNRENYVESEADTEMLNIDFDDISMSTPSTSDYSVDIKEAPITIRSIMNMLPKSPDDQLHEEPVETNNVFISKSVKRGRGRPLLPRTAVVEPPR